MGSRAQASNHAQCVQVIWSQAVRRGGSSAAQAFLGRRVCTRVRHRGTDNMSHISLSYLLDAEYVLIWVSIRLGDLHALGALD